MGHTPEGETQEGGAQGSKGQEGTLRTPLGQPPRPAHERGRPKVWGGAKAQPWTSSLPSCSHRTPPLEEGQSHPSSHYIKSTLGRGENTPGPRDPSLLPFSSS